MIAMRALFLCLFLALWLPADAKQTALDAAKRQQMINRAVAIVQDEVLVMPLHRQVIPWASRKGVQLVHRPNNQPNLTWVRMP
jgi:peptide/nickel transport system substrate-binding protein